MRNLWREIHEETIDRERRFDWRPFVVLVTVAVSLTFQEFLGDRGYFRDVSWLPFDIRRGPEWEIWSYVWWSGWRVLGFFLVPAIVVWCMGDRLRDYGWKLPPNWKHLLLYLGMYLAVLPLVWWMSTTKDFRRIYPFYKLANRSVADFLKWEVLYAAQFVSLEFFFRGFMLFALSRSLGVYAIFVMVVPYNMLHYGKTLVESLAAIIAGLVLGTVALRTRSIWGGIVVHVGVAVTMDLMTVGHLKPPP